MQSNPYDNWSLVGNPADDVFTLRAWAVENGFNTSGLDESGLAHNVHWFAPFVASFQSTCQTAFGNLPRRRHIYVFVVLYPAQLCSKSILTDTWSSQLLLVVSKSGSFARLLIWGFPYGHCGTFLQKQSTNAQDGWMDGWMHGWMDGLGPD